MTQTRTDPIFGKMDLVEGKWTTSTQYAQRTIPITVAKNLSQWESVHQLWHTLQQELQEITQDVAECCHYDCSIEWGTAFPISEEQMLAFIQLKSIHFSPDGCQLQYRCDFSSETWATEEMSEPETMVVALNWDGEIEHFDYLNEHDFAL